MGRAASRKKRERARRKEMEREYKAELRKLTDAGVTPGISFDQAVQLLCHGAGEMRRKFVTEGMISQAPWGFQCDARALEATLRTGMSQFQTGVARIDARGDAADLGSDESMKIILQTLGGAITLGAAALLYLQSTPIPYDLARFVVATEKPDDG